MALGHDSWPAALPGPKNSLQLLIISREPWLTRGPSSLTYMLTALLPQGLLEVILLQIEHVVSVASMLRSIIMQARCLDSPSGLNLAVFAAF